MKPILLALTLSAAFSLQPAFAQDGLALVTRPIVDAGSEPLVLARLAGKVFRIVPELDENGLPVATGAGSLPNRPGTADSDLDPTPWQRDLADVWNGKYPLVSMGMSLSNDWGGGGVYDPQTSFVTRGNGVTSYTPPRTLFVSARLTW